MQSTEIETIIRTEEGVRLSVDSFDEGVWLGLQMRNGSAHVVLTRNEAEQVLAGLQAILGVPA